MVEDICSDSALPLGGIERQQLNAVEDVEDGAEVVEKALRAIKSHDKKTMAHDASTMNGETGPSSS